jgi:Uncharacterized conserved protein
VNRAEQGHRTVPHTADVRIEAWAPTRERCITEAVFGAVTSFVDISTAHPESTQTYRFADTNDEDLLVAVLDQIIYLMDTTGQLPVEVEVELLDNCAELQLAMADADTLPQVGAVPKAVSLYELRFGPSSLGWSCSVTLDV